MQRDAFEQLISDWLDEPQREDLRAQVVAAVQDQPELRDVLGEWRGLEPLLREHAPAPTGVDWERFAGRITSAVQADVPATDSDAALDALLRQPAVLDGRVDWDRQRTRIMAAVGVQTKGTDRRRVIWRGVVAGAVAAAAAVVLSLLPTPEVVEPEDVVETPVGVAVAKVRVSGPRVLPLMRDAEPAQPAADGVAVVRVVARAERVTTEQILIVEPLEESSPASESIELF
jgi:hypothetical protein